jgi:hypothetical protein
LTGYPVVPFLFDDVRLLVFASTRIDKMKQSQMSGQHMRLGAITTERSKKFAALVCHDVGFPTPHEAKNARHTSNVTTV